MQILGAPRQSYSTRFSVPIQNAKSRSSVPPKQSPKRKRLQGQLGRPHESTFKPALSPPPVECSKRLCRRPGLGPRLPGQLPATATCRKETQYMLPHPTLARKAGEKGSKRFKPALVQVLLLRRRSSSHFPRREIRESSKNYKSGRSQMVQQAAPY